MKNLIKLTVTLFSVIYSLAGEAQTSTTPNDPKWSLVFGLNQPILLRGFNFEVNYYTKKFILDYSHGVGLNLDGEFIGDEVKRQELDFKVTHSLGFGFGYRFTKGLNLRIEPKLHIFQMYYDGEEQASGNKITEYSTFTLGLGAYYRWLPFGKKENFLKGITVVPSVRFWPNITSTLKNNEFSYFNKRTNQTEIHKANNIGASNTPWIVNISVGYSF